MNTTEIETKAFDYFNNGYHCAESVFKAVVEAFGDQFDPQNLKIASAFCGGIGKSLQETCGALTGGVMALGQLFGRTEPNSDFTDAWELAAEFRHEFNNRFGNTICKTILSDIGEQENMMACKKMTGQAAGILFDLINERQEQKRAS